MAPVTDDQLDRRLLRLAAGLPADIAASTPRPTSRAQLARPWFRATAGIVTAVLVVAGASLFLVTRPSGPTNGGGPQGSSWPSRQTVVDALTSAKGYTWVPTGTRDTVRATDPSGVVIEVSSPIGDGAAVTVTEHGDLPTSGVQELVVGLVSPGDIGWLRESYPALALRSATTDMMVAQHLPGGIALLEHALVDGASTWTLSLQSDDVASIGYVEASPWPSAVVSPGPSVVTGLGDTAWQLTSVGGSAVMDGYADMVFTELRAGGSVGCGRFSVPYVTDLTSSLVFGPVSATAQACGGDADSLKQEYLAALGRVAGYAIGSEGRLTLSDTDGATVLTFEPTTPKSVVGHWTVTSLGDGKADQAAAPAQLGLSLTFDPDGGTGGFDGCGLLAAGYSVHAERIAIGPLMSTPSTCGAVTDDIVRRYLTALDASVTWSIASSTLELRDAKGATVIEETSGY